MARLQQKAAAVKGELLAELWYSPDDGGWYGSVYRYRKGLPVMDTFTEHVVTEVYPSELELRRVLREKHGNPRVWKVDNPDDYDRD